MLANPPYGKSWKSDMERMSGEGSKKDVKDPRFLIDHAGDPEYSLITRSSDGQMLFLANMLSKMKHDTPLGSRIAEVHNGSSLFTGDAGQGESNIRRWVIENDWLEAIVALPLNMFYNTGIATYVWVITNRKAAPRQGKVQLIDATKWLRPLRKNMGKKNCELATEDIQRICDTFLAFKETPQSKILANAAFFEQRNLFEVAEFAVGFVLDDTGLAVNLGLEQAAQWVGLDFAGLVDFLDDAGCIVHAPTHGVDDELEFRGTELEVELLERGIDLLQEDVVVLEEVIADGLAELVRDIEEHCVALPRGLAEELLFLFVGEALFRRVGFTFLVLLAFAVGFAPIVDELLQLQADGGGIVEEGVAEFGEEGGADVLIARGVA